MAGTGLVVVGASNSTVVGGGGGGGGVISDNKLTVCPSGSCGGLNKE